MLRDSIQVSWGLQCMDPTAAYMSLLPPHQRRCGLEDSPHAAVAALQVAHEGEIVFQDYSRTFSRSIPVFLGQSLFILLLCSA